MTIEFSHLENFQVKTIQKMKPDPIWYKNIKAWLNSVVTIEMNE